MFDFLADSGTIAIIATAVLAILGIVGHGIRKKLNEVISAVADVGEKVVSAVSESGDIFSVIKKAIADNNFSKEEVEEIVKEINEAKGAWKDVFAEVKK